MEIRPGNATIWPNLLCVACRIDAGQRLWQPTQHGIKLQPLDKYNNREIVPAFYLLVS